MGGQAGGYKSPTRLSNTINENGTWCSGLWWPLQADMYGGVKSLFDTAQTRAWGFDQVMFFVNQNIAVPLASTEGVSHCSSPPLRKNTQRRSVPCLRGFNKPSDHVGPQHQQPRALLGLISLYLAHFPPTVPGPGYRCVPTLLNSEWLITKMCLD